MDGGVLGKKEAHAPAWLWISALAIPAMWLLYFFVLTAYSVPQSDDFCFSYRHLQSGYWATLSIFYQTVIGRVVPILLMQLPAAVSKASGFDILICYSVVLATFQLVFLVAAWVAASRLWPRSHLLHAGALAIAFVTAVVSLAPDLREMLYWLPGVACYMVPAAIVILMLVAFVNAAETGKSLNSTPLALGAFVASTCNEFTPVWIVAMVLGSIVAQWTFRNALQLKRHLVILGAALAGAAIIFLAPGNAIRMSQLPMAGHLTESLILALKYSLHDLALFLKQPVVLSLLVITALFTSKQPSGEPAPRGRRAILAAAIAAFCLGCGYFAYFTHQYATGLRLVERAQNEAMILLLFGLMVGTALLSRAFMPAMLYSRNSLTIVPILLVAFALPLYFSKTAVLVREESSSFRTFWLESIARHARLSLTGDQDAVLPKHTVSPLTLMSGDITEDPSRLPNDCIAAFYGKRTVVAGQ